MISIILPIYNAEAFLKRMLVSVSKQTFENYELLLINDGSTDDSELICLEAQQKDKRIRYIRQTNQGVSAARNLGLKESKGEYITFLDADDEIDNNYLYELYNACRDVDISVCKVLGETEEGYVNFEFNPGNRYLNSKDALNCLLSRTKINSGPCAKLFKKNLIESIRFPNLKAYEDILFNILVFHSAVCIRCVDTTAYHYINNNDSAMNKFSNMPSLDIVKATDIIMQYLGANPDLSLECEYITLSHLYQYVIVYYSRGLSNNKSIKESRKVFRKNIIKLIANSYFTWKEKILYCLFAVNIDILKNRYYQ